MTLGSVGKVESEAFSKFRKLLLVPLVVAPSDFSGLGDLISRYWEEAAQQVRNLELGIGAVKAVYHEGTVAVDDNAYSSIARANPAGYTFLKETFDRGAQLRVTEEIEPLLETVDLQRCLVQGLLSTKVAQQISEWFKDAKKRRYEAIAHNIDATLGKDQVGLLIITQDHQVQLPVDIQTIYVAPPALNDITKKLRDNSSNEGAENRDGEKDTEIDEGEY